MNVNLKCVACGGFFKARGDRVASVHYCSGDCKWSKSGRALQLFSHVQQDANGCWNWTAHITRAGYGKVTTNGQSKLAHRAAYEAAFGDIPDGMTLDHLCANKLCCNPLHLEPVTRSENLKRSWRKHAA